MYTLGVQTNWKSNRTRQVKGSMSTNLRECSTRETTTRKRHDYRQRQRQWSIQHKIWPARGRFYGVVVFVVHQFVCTLPMYKQTVSSTDILKHLKRDNWVHREYRVLNLSVLDGLVLNLEGTLGGHVLNLYVLELNLGVLELNLGVLRLNLNWIEVY